MIRTARVLTKARADIDSIFSWLEQRSHQGAANWYEAYYAAVHRIVANPESYAKAPEALPRWQRHVHQALFKTTKGRRYRILFELTDTEIRILRVRGPGQPPLRRQDLPQP